MVGGDTRPRTALVLFGFTIHNFLATGLAAMLFILLVKGLIAPHLPAGAQKLIGSV